VPHYWGAEYRVLQHSDSQFCGTRIGESLKYLCDWNVYIWIALVAADRASTEVLLPGEAKNAK